MSDFAMPGGGRKKEGDYAWKKEPYYLDTKSYTQVEGYYCDFAFVLDSTYTFGTGFVFNEAANEFVLINPTTITITSSTPSASLIGKYTVRRTTSGPQARKVTGSLFFGEQYGQSFRAPSSYESTNVSLMPKKYIVSDDADDFPADGYKDGDKYTAITV